MRQTDLWPKWPWLAVRQPGHDEHMGGLIHVDDVEADGALTVFAATPQSGVKLTTGELIQASDLDVLERYESIEDMLADGWTGYGS